MTEINLSGNKISEESAEDQFRTFLEYYGIEFNHIVIEDVAEAAETLKKMIVAAIRKGEVEVNINDGDLEIIQHLSRKTDKLEKIVYSDKIQKGLLAMDTVSSKHTQGRRFAFMAVLTDLPVSSLLQLKGRDSVVFSRLTTVFSMAM